MINNPATKADLGIKGGRVTTGAIAAGATADVVFTWDKAFTDTNYSVSAIVQHDGAGDTMRALKVVAKVAASVTVRVLNPTAAALTGTLHVIGIKD